MHGFPITPAQSGIFFRQQLDLRDPRFNLAQLTEIIGPLDVDALQAALRQTIDEAEGMRVRLFVTDGLPRQTVPDEPLHFTLRVVDVSDAPDPLEAIDRAVQIALATAFDLGHWPLFDGQLFQASPTRFFFFQRIHHVAFDGFSFLLFTQRLAAIYSALIQGDDPAPSGWARLADLLDNDAEYRASSAFENDRQFWHEYMAGCPEPVILSACMAPEPMPAEAYSQASARIRLSPDTTARMRDMAERNGTTWPQIMTAVMAAYVARLSGQPEVVLGLPVTARVGRLARSVPGMLSNALPLRAIVDERTTIVDLLDAVTRQSRRVLRHQRYRVKDIRRDVGRIEADRPLFGPTVNIMPEYSRALNFAGCIIGSNRSFYGTPDDLALIVHDQGDELGIELMFDGNPLLYTPESVEAHARRFTRLLEQVLDRPDAPLHTLQLVLPERQALLERWNDTTAPYPEHECIHRLLEQQAPLTPDAVALVCDGASLTFAQLNARANRLAHRLIALGVRPEGRVALCMERGIGAIVALFGILKSGGAYIPLDPAYPGERLSYILGDASPRLLVADAAGRHALGDIGALTVLDPNASLDDALPNDDPHVPALASHHLAYVIYTSGSTGKPKGVMVEHRHVMNLHHALQSTVFAHCAPHAGVTLNASIAFDASVQNLTALLSGHRLVIVPADVRTDAMALVDFLDTSGIDVFDCTPTQLESLFSAGLLERRQAPLTVLVGGEPLTPQTWSRLARAQGIRAFNVYGPTECTVDATFAEITHEQARPVIGKPLANTRTYVLDARRRTVPPGAVGELYIGGAGVARGYLNRPELTAERFLDDPFVPGARMYRTGDLARFHLDGNIEFLGRNDLQIKIRGFRIEPGEIETQIASHPAVRDAVVIARSRTPGSQDQQLIAYVTARDEFGIDASDLREHLRTRLPDYMTPAAFVALDALPLTPSGKLDRRALPDPQADAFALRPFEAPQGRTESALAGLWAELLGIERVGRHDNFFALGGHSLLAVTLIERLRRIGLQASVRDLFATPVLSAFADAIDYAAPKSDIVVPPNVITPANSAITPDMLPLISLTQTDIDRIVDQMPGGISNVQDIYALAPLQEGILFHHMLTTEGDPYLQTARLAFDSRARLDAWVDALQQVVARHDILRTAFVHEGVTTAAQVVLRHAPVTIVEVDDLTHHFDARTQRLDLARAPLMQIAIARDASGDRWLMQLNWHHLIGDHATLEVMHAEIGAILDGRAHALGAAQPFRDLVAQARLGANHDAQEAFFRDMLADVSEPTLPFGLTDVHHDGSAVAEAQITLPAELDARLRAQARHIGVGLASLCHLAWARVLNAGSALDSDGCVVFGTVLLGRMQAGVDQALGLVINTLPVRFDIDDASVADSARIAHDRLAALLQHQHAPLALAQRCSGVAAPAPLFNALLNYRHNRASDDRHTPFDGIELLGAEERTNYPLTLCVDDNGDSLGLIAQTVAPLSPAQLCGYMAQALSSLAHALEEAPQTPVNQLDVVPPDTYELLVKTWNDTASYPSDMCIHQLFEQQVRRVPDAVALVFQDQSMTYAQFNARANRLAHRLIALGVGPEDRVALCVERGIGMMVALLAILKSGGAYVPLDPAYSGERLSHILSDSTPRLLLADAPGRAALGDTGELTVIDPDALLDDDISQDDPVTAVAPSHLAYVIYTSGSTGKPKGVMIEHAQIVRLFDATHDWFNFDERDVWCLFHSFAFDFSVWEMWGALRYGGKLVIVPQQLARFAPDFLRLLQRERVTVLNQTPSAFRALIQAQETNDAPTALRYVIFGGEALNPSMLEPWYARHSDRHPRLVNMYGITETTVHVTYRPLDREDCADSHSPIGVRIPDLTIYLLDAQQRLAPVGAVGELYVGGAGVARGYLNRPELTAERFIDDPFVPGARLYRTGDLGRYRPDGSLEFFGRNDHQVKVRGFRIELGEIEAQIASHPAVREAVVIARARDEATQDQQLIAYITGVSDIDTSDLREHLGSRLPDYMVPSAFVTLDALPLTTNGKLDRRALPDPQWQNLAVYVAPRTSLETSLAECFASVLGLERVSIFDDFFALGGHSLLATQLVSRLREALSIELSLRTLFDAPSVAALADALEDTAHRAGARPPLQALPRPAQVPLSFAQERLWFLDQLDPGQSTYNIPVAVRLFGSLDVHAFETALNALVARHESLRTSFVEHDGQAMQCIASSLKIALPIIELDERVADEQSAEVRRLAQIEASRAFDLQHGPLLRARLLRLSSAEHVLLFTMHHIVSDGWSIGVLVRELGACYTAAVRKEPVALPPLPVQYADFTIWQRAWLADAELERQTQYWRGRLADLAPLDLPLDRPRPAQISGRGATLPFALGPALCERLYAFAQREGVTPFMLLLAVFQTLLARLSGQNDVAVGSPIANRTHAQIEPLIGLFVNTLVLRADLSGSPSLRTLLTQVRETTLAAYAHQDLPFEKLVEALAPVRDTSRPALFQVMFVLQNAPLEPLALPGLTLEPLPPAEAGAKFDLTLDLTHTQDHLTGSLNYATDLFDERTIARFGERFARLLEQALDQPDAPLFALDIVLPEEHALLERWNDTATAYRDDVCIQQLFEEQVRRTPDALALIFADQSLTYTQLDARANQLAHRLIALGVQAEDRVAFCMERGIGGIVALMAILKAGGAYVPLDPAYPGERLTHILTDAMPRLLIADAAGREALGDTGSLTVIDPQAALDDAYPQDDPHPNVRPSNLAYVIYTSGSTGKPKGVAIEHGTLVASTFARHRFYERAPNERFLLLSSLAFDSSVAGLFGTLTNGGCLALVDLDTARDPDAIIELVRHRDITRVLCVPSLGQAILDSMSSSDDHKLREIIVAGEACPPGLAKQSSTLPRPVALYNEYGPTEATVWATAYRCLPEESNPVPIGGPIANTRVYLLDAERRLMPVGAVGELYVGGAGVGRGYLNRPELTAERFLDDPFVPGGRMYRTGDIARYRADGNIEFLGRNDHQVKIRGFRIELGEIEAQIASHPSVREAVVIARTRHEATQDQQLIAYVTGTDEIDAGILREHLASGLPDYMVPSAFVVLDALPLTPNGKLDRRALPDPQWQDQATYVAPRTSLEETLAQCFASVLGLQRVAVFDNFFSLGGHSLLATQLVSRVRQALSIDLPLRALFDAPSVAALAEVLALDESRRVASALPPLQARERPAHLPLSFAQERMWFLEQLDPGQSAYNIPVAVRLNGSLDVPSFETALNALVERHESLRTTFAQYDGQAVQCIAPHLHIALPVIALDALASGAQAAELRRLAQDEATRAFDLQRGPLLRALLLRVAQDEHVLLFTMHHIVSDGWSTGVLVRELGAGYAAALRNEPVSLPPLAVQYADFTLWQRDWLAGAELDRQTQYWRNQLAELAPLNLPADRPRPSQMSGRGASVPFAVGAALCERIDALANREGVTPFMLLLAVFQTLLARLSGQNDIAIGSPIANRTHAQTEPLIGLFVNTLVLRADLSGSPSLRELLAQVRETTLAAYAHQDLPFEKLVEALAPVRDTSRTALFQVMFVLQNAPMEPLSLPGLTLEVMRPADAGAKFDLTLNLTHTQDRFQGTLAYATDLFDEQTIVRLGERFTRLLEQALDQPDAPLHAFELVLPDEHALLERWNDTAEAHPEDVCVHRLFEQQVRRSPEATALVFEGESLTYAELNARANRLAHRMIALGVRPDDRVALCMQRSIGMIVALMAILKAGGAYVPLDPAYPGERLNHILTDAAPRLLLADAAGREALGDTGALDVLDIDASLDEALPQENPQTNVAPHHLAYVIYTSGSTGKLKGVMVEHRHVVNLHYALQSTVFARCAARSGIGLNASIAFDSSLKSLTALLAGHRLIVIPADVRTDSAVLIDYLNNADIDALDCTPTRLDVMLASGLLERRRSKLTLLIGGEAITQQTWNRLANAEQIRAFNVYGPTECTVDAALTEITADQVQPVIGKPIANARIYLLDAHLRRVPPGAIGELYIGGAGVSRGYLNRPELTAERFIDDPFIAGARMYRTGDIARYRADGNIEFLGRNDHQVKIRGFRIELGEIEAHVASHPSVREAVVIGRMRHQKTLDQQLVAYVTATGDIDIEALREHARSRLPDYMVPSAFVLLDALPLTPNGKLDRRALPDPEWQNLAAYVAPRTLLEHTLAKCFADVLGLERVSVFDNFFSLGGHSLLATQLVSRLRQTLAIELPLRTLFDAPGVALLAEALTLDAPSDRASILPPLQTRERPAHLPLSFAQERLWFLEQLNPGQSAYHIPVAVRLTGSLDARALQTAMNALIDRHEVLRTCFAQHDGVPVQRIAMQAQVTVPLIALDTLDADAQATEVRRLAQDEATRAFDLEQGPLLRARLLRLSAREHVLLFTIHHIIYDGWSTGVLVRELGACYTAALSNAPAALPPLDVQYADFTLWQRDWLAGAELERQTRYWRDRLEGLAPLDLPTDHPRPSHISGRGASLPFALSPALSERLIALAQREGATPFMLLLAVFQTLLARLSGQTDIAVGSPIANRTHAQVEPLIGLFINTLVMRADLSGSPSLRTLLRQVRDTTLAAYAHQDLPFEKLVEALAPARDTSRTALFQAMFVLQNAPAEPLALPGLTLELLPPSEAGAKFDLTLKLAHTQGRFTGSLSYASDLFDEHTIARLGERFARLLEQALEKPDAPLHAFDIVLPEEHASLRRWNDTAAAYPQHLSIHQLFAQQVRRSPDAIALVFEDESLTYAQLDARANRLAHHLIALGVEPEHRVALCMERGIDMIVALMAILKAGAAYVPLDPASVAERLAYMLDDADVSLLVTQTSLLDGLSRVALNVSIVCPDEEACRIDACPDIDPAIDLQSHSPAYVIYTSGSTGNPKGVVLSHRNLSNYLSGVLARMNVLAPCKMALASTIATDLGNTILFGALVAGHELHVLSNERTTDSYLFGQYMRQRGIDVLKIVPGHLRALVDVTLDTAPALPTQLLVLGGEATRSDWIRRVQALKPGMRILNHYGPTETTVGVLTHAYHDDIAYGMSIPIGRPLANTRAYVLDEFLRPVPLGVTGELYIGGTGLASGYLRRAALTAQRFVADPFTSGERMYRTGDLARYRADGNIEFLGRNDH
ncbi:MULTISPECIES: non-ribosomal peptide synthase/polyketide synthase, partial [unclassified Caballeronia]|uniref:non-ribosomal peptide synthase/polyketide synthase n=1 Tax=unclassified Caballeronia TaxID=2646786 RepID=UPI0020298D44